MGDLEAELMYSASLSSLETQLLQAPAPGLVASGSEVLSSSLMTSSLV